MSGKSQYLIESNRLGLRWMTEEDCGDVVRWRNLERVRRHYIYRRPFTPEGELAYYQSQVKPQHVMHFMICLKDWGGRAVGCVVMNHPDPEHNRVESGLFLGEDAALGHGYGPEALGLGASYVFAHWPLSGEAEPTLMSRIFTDNLPSIRTHERVGYRREGILPQVVCTDGTAADMVVMVLRREDMKTCW